MSQNLSSAAVVIGALRVKSIWTKIRLIHKEQSDQVSDRVFVSIIKSSLESAWIYAADVKSR